MSGKLESESTHAVELKSDGQIHEEQKSGGSKTYDNCQERSSSNAFVGAFSALILYCFGYLVLCDIMEPVEQYYKPVGNLTAREWVGTNTLSGMENAFWRPYTTEKSYQEYEIVKDFEKYHPNQRLENPDYLEPKMMRFEEMSSNMFYMFVYLLGTFFAPFIGFLCCLSYVAFLTFMLVYFLVYIVKKIWK